MSVFEGRLYCTSKLFSSPLPSGRDYFLYLISLTHCQLYQSGGWGYAPIIKPQYPRGLFFTHIKSAEGQGISLGATLLHVFVEFSLTYFFQYCWNTLLQVPCFCKKKKWHNFSPVFLRFFSLIAPSPQHVLPLWKSKHGKWEMVQWFLNASVWERYASSPTHISLAKVGSLAMP